MACRGVRLYVITGSIKTMNLVKILDSSVGQKIVAGATGLALVGFLLVHMGGNLQIFAGADALNQYAVLLKSSAAILWTARLGLLSLILLHIAMTVRQSVRNRRQRNQRYAKTSFRRTTRASRSMMLTGIVVLAFVIFHLLHFTGGLILPGAYQQKDAEGRHHVYAMVVDGFSNPLIVLVYVVGMLGMSIHLKHAISSALQTLGLAKEGHESALRKASPLIAAVIIAGFLVVPISVATGLVTDETSGGEGSTAGVVPDERPISSEETNTAVAARIKRDIRR
uniref:Succinate dehydrogenase cytochrome b558 subunit n=1 Tax=uncultured planctomycete 13FN TaxID=455065 RepID=A9LH46_9BACT|nr:succinate dehydrogenase cytochrome b558 subunit [uncultured planctomycete 13FN]